MPEKGQRRYRRLDRAERAAIERGLDKGRSAREMARDLGRSPSSVADEVRRNRTVSRGPGKGERASEAPGTAMALAGVMAVGVQRVQQEALPLLHAVEVRVLGGAGAGAGRRQAGRQPLRGGVRQDHGGRAGRHGPGGSRPRRYAWGARASSRSRSRRRAAG